MFVKNVDLVACAYSESDFPQPLFGEICFVGRSNVGKSTLLNVLFNKKIARASKRPGKTRSINFYEVNRKYYFVDLPGYGYAEASKKERQRWALIIEKYFENRAHQIKLSILLIDCRLFLQESDKMFLEWSEYFQVPVTIVLSKVDKLNQSELCRKVREFEKQNLEVIPYSAITKKGIDRIIEKITSALQ
ncbi:MULTISPECIES: ribosome biogenesis GTP-binding protein YihA/YsxC [Pseudothermotoga]|uniref:ribosome biogenesis GTP-binding protein YihA/YsxC n=1 Tax=Pseudothermotoga TaxID=1643951 RepID=UPI0002F9798E|nr:MULTISPECIES: ribosome biogenesis GTP-binding protein YihA/YsxC [Pseudothermotoga]KUK20570.1 MAG: putative GTP-binding protein EngB [Pseudothermotoga lettingae]MDI3495337.1 GTP-binding protein [Pseudothermotoga sp.]GLI48759.1 putative GTP-binding protein EngB [Pseudothermotoga lettingae TMO]HBJ80893.1 YihA family ribosome biogenesis GTP-binding protein [Pseudothermotoga sp.]HBT26628.1 YihA family ribosome biogenesis GTP-binding protein [Pseudothermotoga sp.]